MSGARSRLLSQLIKRTVTLLRSSLPRFGLADRKAFRVALIAVVAAVALMTLPVLSLVYFGNSEFFDRGPQTVLVSGTVDPNLASATLLLHRLVPEENAIEASVLVNLGHAPSQNDSVSEPCLFVRVDDRSVAGGETFLPRSFPLSCGGVPGTGFRGGETPRFLLPAYQSVTLYPFDEIRVFPYVRIDFVDGHPATTFRVIKKLPGRTMSWNGDELNWDIRLGRSTNEKVLVLFGAVLFVSLTLLTAWHMATAPMAASSVQDLVAAAGFVIAAAGFRDMLGVTRTLGTSAFELGVFVLPLLILAVAIIAGRARRSAAAQHPRLRAD
jgi:hypothetical protein